MRVGRWRSGDVANRNNTEVSTVWPPVNQKLKYCCLISQPPSKVLSSILGKSNLQFAGMSISLTISTASLNLRTPDSKQVCRLSGRCSVQGTPTVGVS